MSQVTEQYNPDYNPTGIEGGVDTNLLPWIEIKEVPGMSLKTMRASAETGAYSVIVKLDAGSKMPAAVYLSGMDLTVLSGQITYRQDDQESQRSRKCARMNSQSFLRIFMALSPF
jgi:hypothetical protein